MTSFNRKPAILLAALGAVLLIGLAGCGGDEPAPPPPAPPPFVPQTIAVTLGENGGTAQFQTTQAGGFTQNGNPFSSGSTVVSEDNGKTYRVTLSGTTGTAEFVAADQVRLRLGSSGEGLFIDENEDGTYTGTLAASFEETTFRSGDLVMTSRGVQYRLTLEDGSWTAAFEAPPPVQITLGASGYPIELEMTEDGGYTLNGNQFRSGDIVTTPTDSRYRLTLMNGEWQYTYVPPDPIRVSLGSSGDVALLMRRENGSYEIGGTVITSGDIIQAASGNRYRIRFQGGQWTAAFVPDPPVPVTLGMSGLQISLARQEDGSYRYGNEVVQSGGIITASNGSRYRLTLASGAWQATFVPPQAIPVLLGLSGELASVVQQEDGTFQVNGQPLGLDSTVAASNGNVYRITRINGTWSAVFVAPDPVRVMLGTSGQSILVTRREDGTWLGNGDAITSGATVMGPGGTRYQLVLQNSVWVAVWLPTAPVAVVLGTSGDAVVITQVEDGTYRANGDPIASGSVLTASNNTRYRLTFANGQWTATFVAGDPISVQLGTSGTTAVLIRTEDGGFTWNGQRFAPGETIRALNGSEYRLTQVNGQWTATYAPPPPENIVLGTSGEILTLARREDGQWVNPTGMVVRTGSTIRSGAGNQYRLTFSNGSWVAEFQPTSQPLTLGTTGGQVTVVREEDGQYYIGGTAIRAGDTYTAENGNQFRVYLINGEWRAEFVPSVVRVPAGDTNLIVILQRLESGSFLYNGEEFEVGDTITYRGAQYRINITNGVVTLDSESGAIEVPLGNTGDSFTLIRVSDGTFQWEDGRPFRSGTRIVQNGFWWQLTLENGEWSARILGPFDPANPGGPVDPRDPAQPPVDPVTPTGSDTIKSRIGAATVFGLKASSSATTRGTEGPILVVGPETNEVEYVVNDLVGRGTVTKSLTYVQNAQQELQGIIDTINLYKALYDTDGVNPNGHIAGQGTEDVPAQGQAQWDLAKAALNRIASTFGTRLNTVPWSGDLDASEVPLVVAELEKVITELGSAASVAAIYPDVGTPTLTGSDIVSAAISQIVFGSSGNARYAAYSLRASTDTVDTASPTWTVGAFAYSPLEQPTSAELPDRGSGTYRGTTTAVADTGAGADTGTLYSGTIELNAHFSQRRVNAFITALRDSDGASWQHNSNPTDLIRLPEANFSGNQGAFSGSGNGQVRYPAGYGSDADVGSSALTGQVLNSGREIMGTWELGDLLEGAFGAPQTSTAVTPRPTINDGGDGAEAIFPAGGSAPNSSGDITFGSGDAAITVDASSLYSSGGHTKQEPTFVSTARSELNDARSALRNERTSLDSTNISAAVTKANAAVTTIFVSVPSGFSLGTPTDAAGIDTATSLIADASAALGSTSRFLAELGTDDGDVFTGELDGSSTTNSRIAEIFAARPSVFRVESGRTNYTRFGAWRNITQVRAVADKVVTPGFYAYSPLEQTSITSPPNFRATYEGQTVAVRSTDGNLFDGQFQLVVDWTTSNNAITAFVQDLRDSSSNAWFQYSNQDVGFIIFSGFQVGGGSFNEIANDTPTGSIRYRTTGVADSPITPTLDGIFVGSGNDGPFGVIGNWSITVPDGTLTGAFGADLLP